MVSLGNVKSVALVALAVVIVVAVWRSAPGVQQSLGTIGGGLTQSITSAGGGISGFFGRLGGRIGDSILSSFTGGLFPPSGGGGSAYASGGSASAPPAPDRIIDGGGPPPIGIPAPIYTPPQYLNAPPVETPPGFLIFPQSATNRISVDAFNSLYQGDREGGIGALEYLASQGYRLEGDYLARQSGRRAY